MWVKYKYADADVYRVYGTRCERDEEGNDYTEFLIFTSKWQWKDAELYIPLE